MHDAKVKEIEQEGDAPPKFKVECFCGWTPEKEEYDDKREAQDVAAMHNMDDSWA